jgi:hypothetical protein
MIGSVVESAKGVGQGEIILLLRVEKGGGAYYERRLRIELVSCESDEVRMRIRCQMLMRRGGEGSGTMRGNMCEA